MRLTLVAILASFVIAHGTVLAEQCGQHTDADVVIMLDRTGSITATSLAKERAAAKALLGYFSGATLKPRVAIGSFNVVEGQPDARIENGGGLTSNYGVDGASATGLYAAINNISFSNGRTNIEAAISAAQSELAAHAQSSHRHIIVITDGITNEVGGPAPSECSGGNPGAAARVAAELAKANGTHIFGVHYSSDGSCTSGTGERFLLGTELPSSIVTGPEYFYQAQNDFSDLANIVIQISQFISCNDNNSCTADACNPQTNTCEYTPICATPDCRGVPGGNATVDRCGVCGGDGTSCLQCSDVDISSIQIALDSSALSQSNLIQSTLRVLDRLDNNSRASRAYIKRTADSAKRLYVESWHLTYSMPRLITSCANTTFCAQSDNSTTIQKYNKNSNSLLALTKSVLARINNLSRRHVKYAASILKRANTMHKRNLANSSSVPRVSSTCS